MMQHVVSGYTGMVYPVNPRAVSILGLATYPSVKDLPESPDLAVIGVAKDRVVAVVDDCGVAGCEVAVIVTSGFADVGKGGRRDQDRLVEAARTSGVRIVGPNCMGVYSAAVGLYASVGLNPGEPGGVALLSQSGNVGVAMFEHLRRHGVGMHSFVGLGNQADVTAAELIRFLAADDSCSIVAVYVEDVKNGRELLDSLGTCGSQKPVLVLHGGGEKSGAVAARSHTGSLATPARLFRDLSEQCGAIVVDDLDDLTSTALVLSKTPRRRSRRLAVLTDGGGFGVLAADEIDRSSLKMASVGPRSRATMRGALPSYCTVGNPTDVGGDSDSDPSVFGTAGAALLADPGVDALLITGIVGGYGATFNTAFEEVERNAAEIIAAAQQEFRKPVVVQSVWPVDSAPVLEQFSRLGVPVLDSLSHSVRALGHLDRYVEWSAKRARPNTAKRRSANLNRSMIRGLQACNEAEAYGLLRQFGLAVPDFAVVAGEDEALRAAERIGYPVVAKALVASDHKSELGGVVTGISGEAGIRAAIPSLKRLSMEVLIASQVSGVAEVLIGGMHSDRFGPIVTVGLGGLLTDALSIAAFSAAPLNREEARQLLARNPVVSRVLATRRRGQPLAVAEVIKTLLAVSEILTAAPISINVELNPVIVDEQSAWIVDAKIRSPD